ncbi:MAG: hypothetical protein KBS95_06410 [Alistipes sp.]|nr:hypothetical protein [Candidatus Alistipes equi]
MCDEKFLIPFRDGINGTIQNVKWEQISCINWPEEFPSKVDAKFRMCHNGDVLHIEYVVQEGSSLALSDKDNGPVWEDSCAEFFISFSNGRYYNLEANCIGTILLASRRSRTEDVEMAPDDILKLITRRPSLERKTFQQTALKEWNLCLDIPKEAFFKDKITTFEGVVARMNLYKCADRLTVPHYLSWNPITTLHPDFHRPEFFRDVLFDVCK